MTVGSLCFLIRPRSGDPNVGFVSGKGPSPSLGRGTDYGLRDSRDRSCPGRGWTSLPVACGWSVRGGEGSRRIDIGGRHETHCSQVSWGPSGRRVVVDDGLGSSLFTGFGHRTDRGSFPKLSILTSTASGSAPSSFVPCPTNKTDERRSARVACESARGTGRRPDSRGVLPPPPSHVPDGRPAGSTGTPRPRRQGGLSRTHARRRQGRAHVSDRHRGGRGGRRGVGVSLSGPPPPPRPSARPVRRRSQKGPPSPGSPRTQGFVDASSGAGGRGPSPRPQPSDLRPARNSQGPPPGRRRPRPGEG